jgi:hypothetical protein
MNAGKRLIAEVEADLEREYPGITERWRAITAPDAVPGGDDLDASPEPYREVDGLPVVSAEEWDRVADKYPADETVETGRAWPVRQGEGS